ncbi:hypothetical protein OMR07_25900, partial [Methylobacterium organophilum]|nr:hypothetical protein [Methylobacterium organophilum]
AAHVLGPEMAHLDVDAPARRGKTIAEPPHDRAADHVPGRALGGFGALVTEAAALPAALEAAHASGLPACVNVMIESVAAPVIRRPG